MEGSSEHKKLFKYYLDESARLRDNRPLFFRRTMRWRINSREYANPFSKKGLLRGYIKYGVFGYLAWYYAKALVTPKPSHHHEHSAHDTHHGHSHEVDHAHGAHSDKGHGGHKDNSHGEQSHKSDSKHH